MSGKHRTTIAQKGRAESLTQCRAGSIRLIAALLAVVVITIVPCTQVAAQSPDEPWAPPENLSHSGAASEPMALPLPDGDVGIFWWDRFDGLTTIKGTQGQWSDPETTPIYIVEALERPAPDGSTFVSTPIESMPRVTLDGAGGAHALWLAEAPEPDEPRPLLYARMAARGAAWSSAQTLSESASGFAIEADASGALHVAYFRDSHTSAAPSGVIYRRSVDGGRTWSRPVTIHQSLYYRTVLPEQVYIQISADGAGNVFITWNDPQLNHTLLTASTDGGTSWAEPVPVGPKEARATNAGFLLVPGEDTDETWLQWEGQDDLGGCALYQSPVSDVLEEPQLAGQRVLEQLTDCPSATSVQFLPLGQGQVLMIAGGGTDALTWSVWNGQEWSEPERSAFRFEDSATGAPVYLNNLSGTLLQMVPAEGAGDQESAQASLVVVGVDEAGDVWATQSQVSALDVVYAPPSPWSAPMAISQAETHPELPAVVADPEGWVHALWAEPETPQQPVKVLRYARWNGASWTRPTTVLQSPEGSAYEPSLTATADRLHAVWSGGSDGQIWYSRAFLGDAYAAGGWDEPRQLPGPTADMGAGSRPQIISIPVIGPEIHSVYAVPTNEDRGIYYTYSGDAGETWSAADRVFDAAGAGWAVVDYPRIAIDARGTLHVVWIRTALSAGEPSRGIYYARSDDVGMTWSQPHLIAEGDYLWPQVVADGLGSVHVFWAEATGAQSWWHQRSTASPDGSEADPATVNGWTRAARIPGLRNIPGPIGIASDGALGLQLVGLGSDNLGSPALLHLALTTSVETDPNGAEITAWLEDWGELQTFRLEAEPDGPGVSAAMYAGTGNLDVIYRAAATDMNGDVNGGLWHTGRAVSVATMSAELRPIREQLVRTEATSATAALEPAAHTPETTVAPDVTGGPPPVADSSMGLVLPLLLSGGIAGVIVIGVFGTRLLARRQRQARL